MKYYDDMIYTGSISKDFYFYCLGNNKKLIKYMPFIIFSYIMYFLGIIDKKKFVERKMKYILELDNIDECVKKFWEEKGNKKIRKNVIKKNERDAVIISLTPLFLLKKLKKEFRIKKVIAPDINKKQGKITVIFNENNQTDNNKKINNESLLIKLFMVIFFIIFGFLFVNVLFNNKNTIPKCTFTDLIISAILYLTYIFILFKLVKKDLIKNWMMAIIVMLFVGLQLLFAYYFAVRPSWDFGAVYNAAITHVEGGTKIYNDFYFYRYGNNLGITIFLVVIFKIFRLVGITKYGVLGIILNIGMIDLSVLFLYKTIKLFLSKERTKYYLILILMFTPFITYVPIFYTDTLSMPFAIAAIYFYFKSKNLNNKKSSIIYLILCGLLLGFGAVIKITVLIVFIALIITNVLLIKKKEFLNLVYRMAIILVFVLIPLLCLNIYKNTMFDKERLNNESFPYTHWVMMGMQGLGGYNHPDVEYTLSYDTYEEKTKANIEEIKKRFKEKIKDKTLISSYVDKLVFIFGDGTFFAPEKLHRFEIRENSNKNYILKSPENKIYLNYAQIEWIIIFAFIIIGIPMRKRLTKEQSELQLLVYITMFGLFMFFILWEARSRYLVNMIPIMLLGGFIGMESLFEYIKNKLNDRI